MLRKTAFKHEIQKGQKASIGFKNVDVTTKIFTAKKAQSKILETKSAKGRKRGTMNSQYIIN